MDEAAGAQKQEQTQHAQGQASEMLKKDTADETSLHQNPSLGAGQVPAGSHPIGTIPVEAPPPYSTVFVQGGHQHCPVHHSQHPMYPPGTQIVYRVPEPLSNPPDDYLIYAILVTVFCFWPTGIIAIIKALDVQKSAQIGDATTAATASRSALQMSRISLIIGVLVYILLAIILIIEFILIFSM